ncbi:MAG TPA: serine hydrolase [Flavisolibacter sp.]|jgi:hypothetical protein|nr:serine hydrolase [Flavisolibacter sp.]
MRKKILIRRISLLILAAAVTYGIFYAWYAFPIISGFSAKNACSCAFIQGRTAEQIGKEELGSFPLSIGSFEIDKKDGSVTAKVWGLAKRKAIFREGWGCTLVNETDEATLRAQEFPLLGARLSQDSIAWPDGDLATAQSLPAMDKALAVAFEPTYKEKEVHTRALLIVHKGNIIAEKYADGYTPHTPFLGWSMAKSITSTLIGMLVQEGRLDINAPAPVPQWQTATDRHRQITTKQLLQQMSGIDFEENYAKYSNVTNMLFNKGNMAAYTASLPVKYDPGTYFYYSSGNSNILSRIVRDVVDEKTYAAYPYDSLFRKIGMLHTLLEPDASGTYVGSSYVYASARDYARFGLLYLGDGLWNGRRLLPEGWVRQATTAPAANSLRNYGFQFWLNGKDDLNPQQKAYPEMPDDLFLADGYGGQRIYMVPSKDLVIVRMGLNSFDEHRFLKEVMAALPQ